ncbi:arginine deiminase type-3 [Metarhizium guizhouense ARSEF 977]|uniref:Arginine deiminase type-3 n=1 Tax=Metarhizium guizhouense (strain ARSEF 977) TaxID=1276136 RepID=A0A0B4G4U8_METGA|nr:arginine deiminase type-3 [Metarhizium guizhouense ARSEF 977]
MFGLACLALALPLTAALPQSRPEEQTAPFKADLRVDTNRDGTVDLSGQTDSNGKDTWSETSGALFLPNIGVTGRHCGGNGISSCHDASTNAQWAPEYMAPMRTVPMPDISDSATATIAINDAVARENVRIFLDYPGRVAEINFEDLMSGRPLPPAENDRWVYLENDTPIPADKLRQGLTLGIDARDTRRPGGWDGRVSVEFTVTDGSRSSSDKVMLRVAPVLTHHHLQPVKKVFVTKKPLNEDMTQAMARVEQGIQKNMQKAGIKEPLHRLDIDYTWAQDVMEPAYASIPGPSGPITLRIHVAGVPVIAGTEQTEKLLFQDLRREGMGAVRPAGFPAILKHKTLEAGGNMESIPPYTHNGKKYPAGRIVIGATDAQTPQALAYLRAQETQDPIALDTTWLFVKHVDEVLSFLPAKTSRGWRLALLDPMMGYEALSKLDKDGHGDVPLTSNPTALNSTVPTIREFLADESTKKAAAHAADKMKQVLRTLRQETGITDGDVVRIPAVVATMDSLKKWLHVREGPVSGGNGFLPLNSAFPSQVNGVPLSDSVFVAPKPWGPVVDGEDIMEKMSREAYAAAGFDVDFIDDWDLHLASGDLHCYTNTYRAPEAKWCWPYFHVASSDYQVKDYISDADFIGNVVQFDSPLLGDITGFNCVHLQCHIGTDMLGLARLGAASVTGLDFSGVAITAANFCATRINGPAASVVSGLLKRGGRLFVREFHPVLLSLDDGKPDEIVINFLYFKREEPIILDRQGTYVDSGDYKFGSTRRAVFNHGIGEVVQALLDEGMRLTMLREHQSAPLTGAQPELQVDERGEYSLKDRPWRLPLSYTLQAVKD